MADEDALDDLRDLLDEPRLTLPIGGRKYVITEVDGQTWLRLIAISERVQGRAVADDDETIFNSELFRMTLTPAVFDDMLEHARPSEITRAGMTAFFWQTGSRELARLFWQTGGKARSSQRTTSTSSAEASSSRRRASGSGTTSRRQSSAASKTGATRKTPRRGGGSSRSGG